MTTARLRKSQKVYADARGQVAERSGNLCEICGTRRAEQHHHRLARQMGGSSRNPAIHDVANLLHVCLPCHEMAETHPDRWDFGWKVHRGLSPRDIPVLYRTYWVWLTNEGDVIVHA